MKQKSIILMGMKHSGKTTLSVMLAWEMKTRSVDLDEVVEEEYRSDRLLSCREIYKQHGREFFMDLEQAAAEKLATAIQDSTIVVSLGGGTIENKGAVDALDSLGTFVHLIVDLEVLYRRIMKGGLPAFLSREHPFEDFAALYEKRSTLMSTRADITVTLPEDTVESSLDRLITKIKEYGYAW